MLQRIWAVFGTHFMAYVEPRLYRGGVGNSKQAGSTSPACSDLVLCTCWNRHSDSLVALRLKRAIIGTHFIGLCELLMGLDAHYSFDQCMTGLYAVDGLPGNFG